MRTLFLLSGLLFSFTANAFSTKVDSLEREQYERRIASLEARVDRLERLVGSLTPTNAPDTAPAPRLVQISTPRSQAKATDSAQTAMPQPVVQRPRFETPPELVPEIGKIGAEVGLLLGGSVNPFKLDRGSFSGGFIDLPLFDRPAWLHGKISYEISVGLSQSTSTFSTTSNVAQVANLSVLNAVYPTGGLQNVSQAVSGAGAAPFPTTVSTQTRLRLLQVVPFSLKYTTTALDRWRLRPYVIAGFGAYVTIHDQNAAQGNPATYGVRPDAQLPPAVLAAVGQLFGGQSPFGAPLVAGQISQSPELVARGLPGGNGNIDLGLHTGGGIAYRLTQNFSLGADIRYNKIAGTNGSFTTYGSRISLHF